MSWTEDKVVILCYKVEDLWSLKLKENAKRQILPVLEDVQLSKGFSQHAVDRIARFIR